ncbi:MAG: ECF RNA polymerase sigma-E factor [Verrucomicrobia subdivision 3 bacterium]|nr:ECF RNA polymerase sigma-E factor [Limisphaerales bacterium]MCS1415198.1 ECF RNA polymerase sigma-E factor [Limisphaerales bacterium]
MSGSKLKPRLDPEETKLIQQVKDGQTECFETLIEKYQPRIFATARKYARRESVIEDIVQEVFIKAFQKLHTFRGEAPFEHWLMRLAVRTCYDFLRSHQKNRESHFSEITDEDASFLDRYVSDPNPTTDHADAAKVLIHQILDQLDTPTRMVITLQEIEGKSVKEIAALTGWSTSLVKVRAFRARKKMRKLLEKIDKTQYL